MCQHSMKDKQEVWTMMIISAFAKKQGLSIAAAAKLLLQNGGIEYLTDCYSTLHLLSNDDVVDELIQLAEGGGTG